MRAPQGRFLVGIAALVAAATLSLAAATSSAGATATDATVVPDPSWTCGHPAGIAPPTSGTLAFRATLQIGAVHDAGTTQYGRRRVFDVKGGTVTGDRVRGTVLGGGMDLELTLPNGNIEVEQINVLRLGNGANVYLRTCGAAAAGDRAVRIVPDFEAATTGANAWLNTGQFAGTRVVDTAAGTIELAVYDVTKASAGSTRVQLKDPEGVPDQPWECATGTGTKGATVFTESVALGSAFSISGKRGTRNVIPITGGTVSGRVTGSVIPGGADYQLVGSGTAKLDARYALSTKDGEYILVRNCGPMGAMVPTFETRADGPYAFLDANTYLSSNPKMASGGVSITFYERA